MVIYFNLIFCSKLRWLLVYCLVNLLFNDILLLSYYANLNSSIICCLFSGDIYLCFGIYISFFAYSKLFFNVSLLKIFFEGDSYETLILSAILLPIKLPVASAVFKVTLFEAVFITSVVDFLALSRSS